MIRDTLRLSSRNGAFQQKAASLALVAKISPCNMWHRRFVQYVVLVAKIFPSCEQDMCLRGVVW